MGPADAPHGTDGPGLPPSSGQEAGSDRAGLFWYSFRVRFSGSYSLSRALRSKANSREAFSVLYSNSGFKSSGLMIEFRLLVCMGRSG